MEDDGIREDEIVRVNSLNGNLPIDKRLVQRLFHAYALLGSSKSSKIISSAEIEPEHGRLVLGCMHALQSLTNDAVEIS